MADHPPPSPSKSQDNSAPADHPGSDDDLDADTLAMNALMGFSSFAPTTNKKRRFNDIDDAFTGQPKPSSLPPKPPAPSSSGANSLPIMPRAATFAPGTVPADVPEPVQSPPPAHGGRNHGGGHGRDPRDRKEPWWTEYYDPSSNENPWERLEQARGLEAAPGGWIMSRSGAGGGGKAASEARGGVAMV
ncbi:hypothetical protein QBC39DRAFT_107750 [Podospora conica]|nr:hypothetical protein QBC39DRAFT_107750 [Schizothecium conicum]